MKPRSLLIAPLLLAAASLAHGQHNRQLHQPQADNSHGKQDQATHSPYSGMQSRTVKALSDQQIADLRAGKGMSLALPAELNGYPGPAHTLELADQLKLSAEQKGRTQELFSQMQREAKASGEDVLRAETALDALFKEKKVTPEGLTAALANAAHAQGKLRETHLRYHLAMMAVLSADQVAEYGRLRGY